MYWEVPRTTPRAPLFFRKPHCSIGLDSRKPLQCRVP
jgi:hypothetical protein